MYEVVINQESLEGVNLEVIKQYLRTEGCDAEDALLESQTKTAIKMAENHCNTFFTVKNVTITSDQLDFSMEGILDEITEVKKDNSVVTTGYEVQGKKNPLFLADSSGTWEVTYTTKAFTPPEFEEFVRQAVYKMYERGESDIPAPDFGLLKQYRRLIWLV